MRPLKVFESVTLDGFFVDDAGGMDWAHRSDPEWIEWTSANAGGASEMVFGRVTYEQMAAWWPTAEAAAAMPVVARGMNATPRVVFSRTLAEVTWEGTRLVRDDLVGEVGRMKEADGPDLLVMGSGSIVTQLATAGLVDEFQFVVVPVALGAGRTLFDGVTGPLAMELVRSQSFSNGNVVSSYRPAA